MKSHMKLSLTFLFLGALALLVPACGGDSGGGSTAAKPSRRAAEKPVVEEEVEKPAEEAKARYSYNSIGKRDPFRSFIAKELVVGSVEGPLGPLQKHEIDQYALRGIVWNVQAPRALVEDPDGIGHVVDLGTLIGKNWGKVTQIKPQEIIITEEYRDPIENELIINEITMRLPDPEEVGK
jgi:type IV pilus assembly protein PilP